MINVTKTYLPDKEKFKAYVDKVFESGWLTNNGQFVKQLTERLQEYLGVKNLLLVSNGTIALQVAYKLLKLQGDVVTTPFSFVATTSTLVWEGLNPIFADIDPDTLTIDPKQIEARITEDTTAIVATHVFGNPCNVEALEEIAEKYNLKIIYDAAHAFGVKYNNTSVLNYGDISTISFHSTKLFHTIEGGALVIKDDQLFEQAKRVINFGIVGPSEITHLGINAKMNEISAVMGLCVLDDVDLLIYQRKRRTEFYRAQLAGIRGLAFPRQETNTTENYSYFPVMFDNESVLLGVMKALNDKQIFPRRYFHPSLESLNYVVPQSAPISSNIASRILCLPLYPELSKSDQSEIVDIIRKAMLKPMAV